MLSVTEYASLQPTMTDVVLLVEVGNSPTSTRRTNDKRCEESARDSHGQRRLSPPLSNRRARRSDERVESDANAWLQLKWPGRVFSFPVTAQKGDEQHACSVVARFFVAGPRCRDDVFALRGDRMFLVTFNREV
jgi:hypothetical protein